MNKEFWGGGRRILGILLADFRGKQNDGSVISLWNTLVLYKFVSGLAQVAPL